MKELRDILLTIQRDIKTMTEQIDAECVNSGLHAANSAEENISILITLTEE